MDEFASPFKIDLPVGWEDQTVYHFQGPAIDGTPHTLILVIDRHLQDVDIREFANQRIEPITQALQGLEVLKSEETTIEFGHPTYEFVYKWMPSDDVRIYQKYIFVIGNGLGFTFSASFTKKSFKTLALQLKDVVEAVLPGTYKPLEEE